jgi:hypothetical protein
MLFDLQSPRRRGVIKVIYAFLAILMGGGLIFFGIGSDATGGLSEVFSGNDGAGDTGFEDQISEQEDKLVTNPQDVAALTELVQLHFQAGTSLIEVDESTGQQNVTPEAEEELQKGADAWDQLAKASKDSPPSGAALTAVQTFSILAQSELTRAASGSGQTALDDADDSLANWRAAAEAQATIAGQRSADDFARLASLYYFAGEIEQGDEAAAQAAGAAKGEEAKTIEKELDAAKKQAEQITGQIEAFRAQLKKAGAQTGGGAATGENPLSEIGGGGLSGGSGLTTP